jgi:hypothetical protein
VIPHREVCRIYYLASFLIAELEKHIGLPAKILQEAAAAHNFYNRVSIVAVSPSVMLSCIVAKHTDISLLKETLLNLSGLIILKGDIGVRIKI